MSAAPQATLRLAACRAVLAGAVPSLIAGAPGAVCVKAREPRRAVSPAASYAIDAVGALGVPLTDAAVFTFAGPPGSALHLFEPARDETDRRLVSPGFGQQRSRRIHPFLLLLSLQNQVAASLSLHLGLRGPCSSTTDSAGAFADLLPNLALQARTRPVLAVFASAADRAEHRSRGIYETGARDVVEGAVALLFTAQGALGSVSAEAGAESASSPERGVGMASPFAPVLEPGLAVLRTLAEEVDSARIEVREPGRTTAFRWSRAV